MLKLSSRSGPCGGAPTVTTVVAAGGTALQQHPEPSIPRGVPRRPPPLHPKGERGVQRTWDDSAIPSGPELVPDPAPRIRCSRSIVSYDHDHGAGMTIWG
jgi:hypothetical protein